VVIAGLVPGHPDKSGTRAILIEIVGNKPGDEAHEFCFCYKTTTGLTVSGTLRCLHDKEIGCCRCRCGRCVSMSLNKPCQSQFV
jgi:hypothetical protein